VFHLLNSKKRIFWNNKLSSEVWKVHIGKLYEVETKSGIQTHTSYIGDVAILKESSEDVTIRFTHRDRLGSVSTFTDQNGQTTLYRSYDPFGSPKGGNWRPLSASRLSTLDTVPTRRGFTDHEHLDEVELIHMNGRVYDYNVGRFLSVDPFIQEPGNGQSVNPYSYVMNNPLGFTDPTGYIGSRIKDSEGEDRDTLAGVQGVSTQNQRGGYDATKANAAFNGATAGTPKNGGPEKTVDIEGETSKKEVSPNDDGNSVNDETSDFSAARNHDELLAMVKGEEYAQPSKAKKPESTTEFIRVTTLTSGVSGLDNVTFDGEDLIQLKADSVTFGAEGFWVDIYAYPINSNGKMIPVVEPQGVRHSMKQALIGGLNSGTSATINVKSLNWDTQLHQNFRWKVQRSTQQQIHQNSNSRSVTVFKKETSE